MANKGIMAYLSKLSDEDLDMLVAQVRENRKAQGLQVPAKAPEAEPCAKAAKFTDKAEQERLRAEYRSALTGYYTDAKGRVDERMVDYCTKAADVIVELGGSLVVLDKPSIETSFCFGYGQNGVSTEEDSRGAFGAADHVKSDGGEYFKKKNLSGIDELLALIDGRDHRFVLKKSYRLKDGSTRLMQVIPQVQNFGRQAEPDEDGERYLTDEEVGLYREALVLRRERFEKRLDVYLKRYGTSKLHTWAFLVD